MRPTLEEILEVTLRELNVSKESYERAGKSRIACMVRVKQIVSYVGYHFGYTLHAIGNFLHLTHCTVYHNKEMAKDFCHYEHGYACKVNKVLSYFENTQRVYYTKGWVARNENGEISFFQKEPSLLNGVWVSDTNGKKLPKETFPQISPNDIPLSCELTLRLK